MSNSSLISLTRWSPNCNKPRKNAIDTIAIHCMAGDMTIESCGNWFAQSATRASSQYGIGSDGRIGLYVNEAWRSWCTSSAAVDNRAVTIEVASKSTHPYAVTDAAYKSLILLVADICQRNNIKKILWQANKSLMGDVSKQNMVVHRWTANKACPGDYLFTRHYDIMEQVNAILQSKEDYLATMTEKQFNEILDAKLNGIKPITYKFIEDVPTWGRESVQKLLDKKFMAGTGTEDGKITIDISNDLLRTIVLMDRAGLFN